MTNENEYIKYEKLKKKMANFSSAWYKILFQLLIKLT